MRELDPEIDCMCDACMEASNEPLTREASNEPLTREASNEPLTREEMRDLWEEEN